MKREKSKNPHRTLFSVLAIFPLLIAHCSLLICTCSQNSLQAALSQTAATPVTSGTVSPFASFRDIPGVTAEEIAAIEEIQQVVKQKEGGALIYGMNLSTEAFLQEDGGVEGYAALFCEWLTGLFGIRFQPEIYSWPDLVLGLRSGEIDFTGELTPTEERRKTYRMTDAIAERQYKAIRVNGSRSLDRIAQERLPRYAFVLNAVYESAVAAVTDRSTYETVWVRDFAEICAALESGEADAFVGDGVMMATFDAHGGMYAEDFLPLVYTQVSMATVNLSLEPVISVITKALRNGAMPYLNNLYKRGDEAYRRYKFSTLLSDEEKDYLRDTVSVPTAYQYFNYPIAFFDFRNKKWDGISIDILYEVEKLTGFTFDIINDEYTEMPELIAMLSDGKAHMFCDLIYSAQRAPHFLWNKNKFMADQYALLSKVNYPNVSINEIPYKRISLIRSTAHAEMFRTWFPGALYATEYPNSDDAFLALERDEVDLVMVSKSKLLWYSNFYEFSGYKANFLFNHYYESAFAFNKDKAVLCSIVDKAVSVLETGMITEQWMTKTYDFRARMLAEQRPWLIGAIVLSFVILTLILVMLYRSRGEGKRLAKLVAEQTATLVVASEEAKKASAEAMRAYAEAETASEAKSRFIANMSHEMRTPMNVIVGLTGLMLEETGIQDNTKETLKKINTAGNTLTELINDVLDISKVDAGKMDLMPVKYDVASFLNDIITLNMIRIEDKPIVFKLDIDENLPASLFGDDLRIKQILNNLLSNAFKFTKEGIVTLGVSTKDSVPKGDAVWVSFYINDTGIGLREEDMAKLFTDYNQVDTKANREIQGTGLGLSITKKFVELMSGEITVESEYAKGATFRVRIRQGFVNDSVIGEETAEKLRNFRYSDKKRLAHEKLVRSNLSHARVLVVDDFSTNLDVAAGMLRKYKMQVDCVMSGQESVDRIAAGEPVYDAVFMDHMMPGMDGIEAVALIRALGTKYARNIPIIALTANAVAGSEQMFLNNGFNAFIPKPFNAMILDTVIRQWIGTGKSEQETVKQKGKPVFEGEILICEDNKMNQEIICERLAKMGLKTVVAENGKEGVEMVLSRVQNGTKPFDLIFMDIYMPVMDGLEAAAEIGKQNTGTPVIAMTPDNTPAEREKYLASGMPDCLKKPFTSKELSDCLMKHLKPQDVSPANEKKLVQDDDLRFDEDLQGKFIRIFVNNNKTKYEEITKAVNEGDITAAHRLAHSLKGNAGMIGKKRLQRAAEDVQNLFKKEDLDLESEAYHFAMDVLKAELDAVLNSEQ